MGVYPEFFLHAIRGSFLFYPWSCWICWRRVFCMRLPFVPWFYNSAFEIFLLIACVLVSIPAFFIYTKYGEKIFLTVSGHICPCYIFEYCYYYWFAFVSTIVYFVYLCGLLHILFFIYMWDPLFLALQFLGVLCFLSCACFNASLFLNKLNLDEDLFLVSFIYTFAFYSDFPR